MLSTLSHNHLESTYVRHDSMETNRYSRREIDLKVNQSRFSWITLQQQVLAIVALPMYVLPLRHAMNLGEGNFNSIDAHAVLKFESYMKLYGFAPEHKKPLNTEDGCVVDPH